MTSVVIHLVVFAIVNAFLVLLWLLTGGGAEALGAPVRAAREDGFWPLWVLVSWGVGLALHVGIAVPIIVTRRRRRRRRARRAAREALGVAGAVAGPATGKHWIAAMFTDICDSSGLAARLGDDEWGDVIAAHRRAVREVAAAHDGTEVGTQGDGFLLRFDSPRAAVRCAVALQERFATDRAAGTFTPAVRIGIHAGEALAQDGDVLGQMVNVAARVADAAGPGEVLVTEPVADHAPAELDFEDRGLQALRGARAPRHLLALRPPTVGG